MALVHTSVIRILYILGLAYLITTIGVGIWQRRLLYFPSHEPVSTRLGRWMKEGMFLGYARVTAQPAVVWLMTHGNGGQAAEREYTLSCFPEQDSVYFLEYPGYGPRAGSPSLASINAAAKEGYEELRRLYPGRRVCVAGESLGTGPACYLCTLPQPPDKVVLVVPFNRIVDVAAEAFRFLPVRWLMLDRWNNAEALRHYSGPIEIYGAKADEVIPVKHATSLAHDIPQAKFQLVDGRHNEWYASGQVRFTGP